MAQTSLNTADLETLRALVDAPDALNAAREHWKYSKLATARETLGNRTGQGEQALPSIAGLVPALLADAEFCPVTAQALLDHERIQHVMLDDDAQHNLDAGDALAPLVIEVSEGARASVIDRAASSSQWVVCLVRPGASLNIARLKSGDQPEWSKLQILLEESAQATLQSYAAGGAFRRHDVSVDLLGKGAHYEFIGAAAASGKHHLDLQSHVRHHAPASTSVQTWHTIGREQASLTYRGRILIDAGCPQVDASLSNKNLALGDGVTINTKPELEIYSDDVRCAHGATVGQLDEEALFYLQARGVDAVTAAKMLAAGFLNTCIEGALAEEATALLLDHVE